MDDMVPALLPSAVISLQYSLSLHVGAVRRLSWWRLKTPQYNKRTVLSGLRINLVEFGLGRTAIYNRRGRSPTLRLQASVSANPLKDPIVYLLNF